MRVIVLCLLLSCLACSEFLSPDVRAYEVQLLGPADSLHICRSDLSFWWEPAPIAEHYRFQLVRPDFQRSYLFQDTLLVRDQIDLNLGQGVYAWRLRVENAASASAYASRGLVVDCTAPVQAVALYPRQGDTLSFSEDSLVLHWYSSDEELDGFVFPVSDSVYLYEMDRAQLHLAGMGWTQGKRLDIQHLLEPPEKEKNRIYCWVVKSIDKAGNTQKSLEFTFVLK